jgi:tetratricopeptide (TPR) repeat protein
LNLAQVYAASMHYLCDEPAATLRVAAAGAELALAHGFQYWLVICTIFVCWATARLGAAGGESPAETKAVIAEMKAAFAGFRQTGAGLLAAHYLGVIAAAQLAVGDRAAAWETIGEALALAQGAEDQWNVPSLHRLRGDLLLLGAGPAQDAGAAAAAAEAAYRESLELARGQAAHLLELRAATSLAALWVRQGRHAQARQLLASLLARLGGGGDRAILRAAAELVAGLPPEPPPERTL